MLLQTAGPTSTDALKLEAILLACAKRAESDERDFCDLVLHELERGEEEADDEA
jgi:hypothetical protein